MAKALVGKWGKNLAVRVPAEIVQAIGLKDGEQVEIEAQGGEIVIHRGDAQRRADARKAADEIIAESRSYSLGGVSIRELIGRDEH